MTRGARGLMRWPLLSWRYLTLTALASMSVLAGAAHLPDMTPSSARVDRSAAAGTPHTSGSAATIAATAPPLSDGYPAALVVWPGIAVTYSQRRRSGGRCSEGVFVGGDAVE
jgi:hypothetical protein